MSKYNQIYSGLSLLPHWYKGHKREAILWSICSGVFLLITLMLVMATLDRNATLLLASKPRFPDVMLPICAGLICSLGFALTSVIRGASLLVGEGWVEVYELYRPSYRIDVVNPIVADRQFTLRIMRRINIVIPLSVFPATYCLKIESRYVFLNLEKYQDQNLELSRIALAVSSHIVEQSKA